MQTELLLLMHKDFSYSLVLVISYFLVLVKVINNIAYCPTIRVNQQWSENASVFLMLAICDNVLEMST